MDIAGVEAFQAFLVKELDELGIQSRVNPGYRGIRKRGRKKWMHT